MSDAETGLAFHRNALQPEITALLYGSAKTSTTATPVPPFTPRTIAVYCAPPEGRVATMADSLSFVGGTVLSMIAAALPVAHGLDEFWGKKVGLHAPSIHQTAF